MALIIERIAASWEPESGGFYLFPSRLHIYESAGAPNKTRLQNKSIFIFFFFHCWFLGYDGRGGPGHFIEKVKVLAAFFFIFVFFSFRRATRFPWVPLGQYRLTIVACCRFSFGQSLIIISVSFVCYGCACVFCLLILQPTVREFIERVERFVNKNPTEKRKKKKKK